MKFCLSIDRYEGDKKQMAVLLADDGTQINFPKALLPKGAKAGEIPIGGLSHFHTAINLKTANALSLEIAPTLIARADEVIE